MSALDEVAAGAWAGLVGTVLGYPLDVVKGRMQTGKTGLPSLPAGAGSRPRPPSFGARRRVGTGVRLASRGARPFPRVRTLFLLPLALDARRRPPSHPAPSPPPKHYSQLEGRSFAHLIRTEGVVGAYRGLGPPVCMMMLMNSMNFAAFARLRDRFAGVGAEAGWGADPSAPSVDWRVVMAGAAVGPLCAVISTPFELVKLQLQLDGAVAARASAPPSAGASAAPNARTTTPARAANAPHPGRALSGRIAPPSPPPFSNALDAATRLGKRHGARVFYLGFGVNAARECVFHAIFFGTYDHLTLGFEREAGLGPSLAPAVAGGIAGAAAWFGNLPLDCVKSGVQGQRLRDGGWDAARGRGRTSAWDAARDVWRRRGLAGFFSGAGPSVARSVVVSGSRFAAFTGALGVLRGPGAEGEV